MTTKNWNNDFMAKVLEEAAWKELSSEFAWNEQLLEKYKNKVSWKEISGNRNIIWTTSMIEKFKNKVGWEEFPVPTTNICSRRRIWRNTRIIGIGVSCQEIPIWNLLPRFWSNLSTIGTGAKSSTVMAGTNCTAWSFWRSTMIIFRHPPCSVPVYGTSWLKTKRNN